MVSILDRDRRPELMDRPDTPEAELRRSLADLRAVNRWLGGTRRLLRLVRPMVRVIDARPIRILDVATGSGDIPVALARWARGMGETVEIAGVDLHAGAVAAAGEHTAGFPEIEVIAADALALPFTDGSFHIATCCTALHHFEEPDAVRLLREMRRVASAGVVVLDLRRTIAALLGVRLLASTVWRSHPITRHDGPASVRGAFTTAELRRLAELAGFIHPVVRGHSLIRLSLTDGAAEAGT